MDHIAQSTIDATGVSISPVKRILKEGKTDSHEHPAFSTPKKKKAPRKKRIEFDSFVESVVRRKIHELYVVKKECPSLNKI
jgi:hypothetical protein